jgi:hypothetical protein
MVALSPMPRFSLRFLLDLDDGTPVRSAARQVVLLGAGAC